MIGEPAPDFLMQAVDKDGNITAVSLHEQLNRKKWTVLFFYPEDFSTICPSELLDISNHYQLFCDLNTDVIGCSTDTLSVHKAWLRVPEAYDGVRGLLFPLASDANHHVSSAYGLLNLDRGTSRRATVVISPEGKIVYYAAHTDDIGRDTNELLRVIQALQTGGACTVNWQPGDELISEQSFEKAER